MKKQNNITQRVGYVRVSSIGQNEDSQRDLLEKFGCHKIFDDKHTGSRMDRPGWDKLMEYIRPGDTLVVTELSRMTRSLLHLLETIKILESKNIELISLRENIDTNSVTGRCFLSIMGAIHQMERELKSERAAAGRASARARGKSGGRPRTDILKLEHARLLYDNSKKTVAEICKISGVSRRTFYYYLSDLKTKSNKTVLVDQSSLV